MRNIWIKYTVAALTFAVGLGVNIDYDQVGQRNSGSWLGAGLALSGAQARGHGHHGGGHGGGGHHGGGHGGGGHHGGGHGGGGHHGGGHGGGGHYGGGHGGGGHYGGGHGGGGHYGHDHYHHGRRAAWRALGAAAFLTALPRGCPLVGWYYYCGGVYYQSTVQSGSTVYVVVTP